MRPRLALLILVALLLFSLIVVGAYVTAGDFGGACGTDVPQDWPLCQGNFLPPPQWGPIVEYSHRILAAFSTLFLLVTTAVFLRSSGRASPVSKLLVFATILLVFQVFLGGLVVADYLAAALVALHQAVAILIFGVTVAAISIEGRFGRTAI